MGVEGEKDYRKLKVTVMAGSFGNKKQHYAVERIKARNMFCETLLLFYGIHTANAAFLAAENPSRTLPKHFSRNKDVAFVNLQRFLREN